MDPLDAILRSSAATAIIIYLFLAIRDGWKTTAVQYSVLTCIVLLAVVVGHRSQPLWFYAPIRLIDTLSVPLVWWSGLALLYTNFRPKALHWMGLSLYVVLVLPWRFWAIGWIDQPNDYPLWITDIMTFLLFGHLAWITIVGFRNDLVDQRRRMRIVILAVVIAATLASTTGENFLELAGYGDLIIAYTAAIIVLTIIAVILWSSKLDPFIIQFNTFADTPEDDSIDLRDAAVHARLVEIMETERAYIEAGLTIGALADRVGVPEHQLRALINQSMGYRNFASFLNSYRIASAKTVLSDPAQARLPVLTIAMDAGFGSLAPFNRAFKAAEGVTPSQYRAKALSDQN